MTSSERLSLCMHPSKLESWLAHGRLPSLSSSTGRLLHISRVGILFLSITYPFMFLKARDVRDGSVYPAWA